MKRFSTYNHVVVMLFLAFEGYHSIREVVLGLLANAHELSHLGLSYVVRRSTFSEANQRRSSKVFGDIPIIKRTDSPFIIREDIKNRLRQYNKNLERILELCGMEQ